MRARYAITASAMVSALGSGRAATLDALHAGRTGLAPGAPGPPGLHVGQVRADALAALPPSWQAYDCRNHRLAEAGLQADGFGEHVAAVVGRLGADRVGTFVGTSTSGIRETEQAYAALDDTGAQLPPDFPLRTTHRLSALADYVHGRLGLAGPAATISTACSSSAKAFAQAARAIDAGLCDAVVVGGVDSLCLTTLHGFHALELTASGPCRPFDAVRDGMCVGEAAAFALLQRAPAGSGVALLGWGESTDAHHMSTPHPQARGARLAIRAALHHAGIEARAVDYVNAHATGTPINDRAEALAIHAELGPGVPVGGTKGWTGHTLGAAGALEALLAVLGLEEGLALGTLNTARVDPELDCNVLRSTTPRALERVLSNSFGFGGNNCTLVLGRAA
ncbi:MAG: beta-ketoacyl-ACP synthase [Halofilum sp. (in: g-proteobacteria)]|nr:beta-ketoacyl-ACP synthase [Halofilum sp. (in: g-proteobacteria)]